MNCPYCASEKFNLVKPAEARCGSCGSRFAIIPIELRNDNVDVTEVGHENN